MADRTVSVRLRAEVAGYIASMQAAGKATAAVGSEARPVAEKLGMISPKMAGIGIAAGAMALTATKKFAEFDAAMSNVKAVTGETTRNMEALRTAAIKAGQDTKYSGKEAADAITNLAKAGIDTADILDGGLKGAMDLAAAGGMEVADAAEAAAQAMNMFKLEGEDVPHIADLLAAAAGKASGDVDDMTYALKMGGLVADQFGISIEETVGTLAAFASAGLQGSDAGTSFKTMLLHLANPSVAAENTMIELGIAAYDAQGKFVGLADLAEQLKTKMSGLDQATRDQSLALIFGTDAIRGANVLYQQGSAGIQKWTAAVDDAGYASTAAATMTDNLKGDIERLTSSLDTLFITAGTGANGPLRDLVKGVTWVSDGLTALKGSWLNTPLLPSFDKEVDDFDAAALAAARVDDAVTEMSRGALPAVQAAEDLATSQSAQADAAAEAVKAQKRLNDEYFASVDAASGASNAAINFEESLDALSTTAKKNGKSLDIGTEKGRANMRAMNDMRDAAVNVIAAMVEQGASQDTVGKKANKMADRMYDAARAAGFSKKEANKLAASLRDVPDKVKTDYSTTGVGASVDGAHDVTRALGGIPKTNNTKVTVSGVATVQGVLNKLKAMDGQTVHVKVSGGIGGAGGGGGSAPGPSKNGYTRPVKSGSANPNWTRYKSGDWHGGTDIGVGTGTPVHATSDQRVRYVQHLNTSYGYHIVTTDGRHDFLYAHLSSTDGTGANDYVGKNKVIGYSGNTGHSSGPHLHYEVRPAGRGNGSAINPFNFMADGGRVRGAGTATSDSIPAMLSDGEYVVRASAVDAWGEDYLDSINAMGGFAKGGKAKKGKKKPKKGNPGATAADRLQAMLDDIAYAVDMGTMDDAGQIASLRAAQSLATAGSSEWREIEVRVHNIGKEIESASTAAAESQIAAAESVAQSQVDAASSAADARVKAVDDAMSETSFQRSMGQLTGQAAIDALAAIQPATTEQARSLALEIKSLQDELAASAAAAAQAIADARHAAVDKRDSYASGVAGGVIGQLQFGQDSGGKRWGVNSTLGDFAKRANAASNFAASVQSLTARGLSREVVQQVVAAGPVAGMDMVRALQAMDATQLASVNASQNAIAASAVGLGGSLANAFMGVQGDATLKVDIGGSAPVVLQLDSRTIYSGLLELQRQSGGSLAFVPRG